MKVISESFGFTVEALSPCLPLCQTIERGEDEEQLALIPLTPNSLEQLWQQK